MTEREVVAREAKERLRARDAVGGVRLENILVFIEIVQSRPPSRE